MTGPAVPFGRQFRRKFFPAIDPDVYPVNHGSWGQIPEPVLQKFKEVSGEQYSNPDKFFHEIRHKYVEALKLVSTIVNCDYRNLAIVENATTGVNTVLRSYPFEKGDKIVVQSNIYGSCAKTVQFMRDRYGVDYIKVQITYPISDEEILEKFEKVFKEEKPKLCLFDTISSMPGVIFPFKEMVKLCKKYNVLSLVDGAHGIGCIPQDLSEIAPDFYISNLHKWYFVPIGCAVLYVDPKYHNKIHTMPISHSYLEDSIQLSEEQEHDRLIDRFCFIGAKNYASLATISESMRFRKEECGGEEAIYQYCNSLAKQVASVISKKWGTSYLGQEEENSHWISTMVNVEVPLESMGIDVNGINKKYIKFGNVFFPELIEVHKAFALCIIHNGKLYARFSCQIYNDLSDYEHTADVLLDVIKESVRSCPKSKRV